MNNVSMEILLIISIFAAGITLCFTIGVISGIAFIILANTILPSIIKLSQPTKFNNSPN